MEALFGGIGRAAISDAKLHAKRDSIDGDLMFLFPVIEAMLMACPSMYCALGAHELLECCDHVLSQRMHICKTRAW